MIYGMKDNEVIIYNLTSASNYPVLLSLQCRDHLSLFACTALVGLVGDLCCSDVLLLDTHVPARRRKLIIYTLKLLSPQIVWVLTSQSRETIHI